MVTLLIEVTQAFLTVIMLIPPCVQAKEGSKTISNPTLNRTCIIIVNIYTALESIPKLRVESAIQTPDKE